MEIIIEQQVMLGDELTTQWVIKTDKDFVIWATFDKKVADKKRAVIMGKDKKNVD